MFHNRYNGSTLVECSECHWRGRIMDCVHEYRLTEMLEELLVALCPKCGSYLLLEIEGKKAILQEVLV